MPFFLIWPFGAMLNAFRNFRQPTSKFIVWFFFVFFGFVFIHSYYMSKDAFSYVGRFMDHHNYWMGFESLKKMFYSGDSKYVDVYQPLVTWIVAYFTGNPRWLFTVFAAVFGYFYVQNIWIILARIQNNKHIDLVTILFLTLFIFINPIWNINGVRMWTAAHVFFYGLLRYFIEGEKRGQLLIVFSIFFHFSFLFPVSLFIIYRFLPKNLTVLLIFFFTTSFIRELDLYGIRNLLSFLPDFFQDRVTIYTNQDYYDSLASLKHEDSLHEIAFETISRYIQYIWICIVYFRRNLWLYKYSDIRNLFSFGLFFGGFAQIAANIPSGSRFLTITSLIFYAVFILMIADKSINSQLKWSKKISIPFILFLIAFQIRIGLDYIGISTLVSNPVVALFFEDKVPLIEFIKGLL